MNRVPKYFNRKQIEAMSVAAKNEVIIASRGFGKSEGIDAPRLVRNVFAMPRSAGALLSPTYGKLLRNTLPAVCHALDRLGFIRNFHYFIGKRAPKELNFEKPYIDPFDYKYSMIWFNGSIIHLVSFDRPMSTNSMSLDYILGFEAKFLDYQKIKTEVLPANRGNRNYFGDCPWHHGQVYTSDMPTSKKGMWLLDKENDMDQELISTIKDTYTVIKRLESTNTNPQKLNRLRKDLVLLRQKATFYAEYNVFDNIEILGEDFVKDMKRDLPPLLFQTSILNKRMRKIENGFYSALNERLHYYQSYNNKYLQDLDYNFEASMKDTCLKDGDIDVHQPLRIAMDYNASINNVVTGQRLNNEMRTLSSFFVKTPLKIKDVVEAWCAYYHNHINRDVIYYYDSTAIADTAIDNESFADTVIKVLMKNNWRVKPVYIGGQMKHNLKHFYIDLALKGDAGYLFPTFNEDNNEFLLLAMEQTGIKVGRNGFEKDKDAEHRPDTQEEPEELKTHITDAWDTLWIGCNFYNDSSFEDSEASIF